MPDERFRKSERLRRRRDFLKVYAEGARYSSRLFTIFARANDQPVSRLGITVSRKIGKAVRRNRAKRLIREVFRKNKARLPRPLDLVVNVKEAIRDADYRAVEAEFLRLIERMSRDLCDRKPAPSRGSADEPSGTAQGATLAIEPTALRRMGLLPSLTAAL
jgi:ribonuclease P protein component